VAEASRLSSLKDLHKLWRTYARSRAFVEVAESLWKPFRLQGLGRCSMGVAHRYALQAFQAWDQLRYGPFLVAALMSVPEGEPRKEAALMV